MKKIYNVLLISCFALAVVACKKDNGKNYGIVGRWELAQVSGAMVPPVNYLSGNGNILEFTSSTYKHYSNGQLIKSGNYSIEEDNTVEQNVCLVMDDGRYTHRIVFDTAQSKPKTFYEIRDGKLAFISGCYAVDAGHREEYRRISDIDGTGKN
ncbi:MAG TPA: hypothetical protein VM187_08595 [Niastella sp.]|nr:hypothetical protein [Niastella sp.]